MYSIVLHYTFTVKMFFMTFQKHSFRKNMLSTAIAFEKILTDLNKNIL